MSAEQPSPSDQAQDEEADMDMGPCWCGVKNPYYAPVPRRCDGSGVIQCHCGGDQCVCHWHGEVECSGCEECHEGDDYGDE